MGVGGGLGAGIYVGLSKTGDGMKTSLEEFGKSCGEALRAISDNFPVLLAGLGVLTLIALFALWRILPAKPAVANLRSES